MTIAPMAALLLGSLVLGSAVAPAVRRLGDGGKRVWVAPTAIWLQGLLALWAMQEVSVAWLPPSMLLAWALLVLAVVDAIDRRLPDAVTLPLIGCGLLLSVETRDFVDRGVGVLAGYGVLVLLSAVYRHFRKKEGMGLGDVKLTAAAGAWLGWQALPSVIVFACVTALAFVSLRQLFPHAPSLDRPLPFGPPLCLAIWIVWLYGPIAV